MRNHGLSVVSTLLLAVALCWSGLSEAGTCQLRVASVSERVFMYFKEDTTLTGIEGFLDSPRSKFVLLRDRQPQALELKGAGQSSFSTNVTGPRRNNPWGATKWDGESGLLAVFRLRGIQNHYQKLQRVAVEVGGVLRRLAVRGVSGYGLQPLQVPATASDYLTRALNDGTFPAWVEQRAVSYEGLSVVVGRRHNSQESDTVYLVVRAPLLGRAYKVILGWKTVKREGAYAITQRMGW